MSPDTQHDGDSPVLELTPDQCWTHLHAQRVGRIALLRDDDIELLPVNYAVDDRTIVVATSSAVLIAAATDHRPVAFEVDAHDGWVAWSVVVRGRAELAGDTTGERPRSMLPTPKTATVRVVPTAITGRLFDQAA